MKIVGIIAEYNPFHRGHQFHIEKARALTGADAVIVVMSGDYVQRGMPAIMPKHLRAQMALACGADVVLELPVCYATGSAAWGVSITCVSEVNVEIWMYCKRLQISYVRNQNITNCSFRNI